MSSFRMTRDQVDSARWFPKAEYPFESRFVELDAGRMHYVDAGSGRPLVLVHGTPSWSYDFRGVITRLKGEHRCLAPDHLGFGLSNRPERGPTMADSQGHFSQNPQLFDILSQKPVLLVWGMADRFVGPLQLARWREVLPRTRAVELADVGHFPQDEAAADVAAAIAGFLK